MATVAEVIRGIHDRHGFLTEGDVEVLAKDERTRLWPLLVRCGGGRFTAPAQDMRHFVGIVTAEGSDYVRDVSLVAGFTGYNVTPLPVGPRS